MDEMILNTPLGPIKISDLTMLDGWRYIVIPVGFPGTQPTLVRGGPPATLFAVDDEMGWGIGGAAAFSSPYVEVTLEADDWQAIQTLFYTNIVNSVFPKPSSNYITAYNPVTPLGPIYSLMMEFFNPAPYARRIRFFARLPAVSPLAQCRVFAAQFSRIAITDIPTFLRSIKKHNLEQRTGRRLERYI